jgi:hypothetical protein
MLYLIVDLTGGNSRVAKFLDKFVLDLLAKGQIKIFEIKIETPKPIQSNVIITEL